MKAFCHIPFPASAGRERILVSVRRFWGLIRDMVKALYLAGIQICTRLFFLEREASSAISLRARLDIIPRAPQHERHRLKLGKKSLIETAAVICTWHGDVILDDGASVGIGSVVIGPVSMGENSACGQYCFISGQSHRYEDVSVNFLRQGCKIDPVIIGKNVWIGSNSVILPGVKIGDNSIIGAGSTVVKDVPSFAVVCGRPAKITRRYNSQTNQWVRA